MRGTDRIAFLWRPIHARPSRAGLAFLLAPLGGILVLWADGLTQKLPGALHLEAGVLAAVVTLMLANLVVFAVLPCLAALIVAWPLYTILRLLDLVNFVTIEISAALIGVALALGWAWAEVPVPPEIGALCGFASGLVFFAVVARSAAGPESGARGERRGRGELGYPGPRSGDSTRARAGDPSNEREYHRRESHRRVKGEG